MGSPYGLELVENCVICKLRSDSFFCGLPKASLEAFEKIKFTAAYPAGAVLFVEGQSPRGIYMLCKGRVKLSTTSSDGKTLILKIAQPGEVLGLHATVSGTPYEITAETGQPCQLNFIKRDDFLRFLQQHGDACLKAAQHLSRDCQSAYQQIRSLGLSHSAPERLARLLLEWSVGEHAEANDGTRIKIALTHEEIAQIIGTSRETVTRTLADFRKRQIAVLKGSTLTIKNKPFLERLVGA
jgi:CRP/FNR family transcriptional regulator, cyclic AMP receptor protein